MENDNSAPLPKATLSAQNLRLFFINHLNRIYCAKSHLHKKLPQLRTHAHFTDLSNAIEEAFTDVNKQILRLDKIYDLLETQPKEENCHGVIGLIEDAFSSISQERDPEMRDLSILFYLQNIESIEMASFQMLNLAAPLIDEDEIRQLLKESFDEASEDLNLFQLISSNYFRNR